MKKTILLLGTILGLFSCSKYQPAGNNGSSGQQNNSSLVSSFALYSPLSKNLTKYTFAHDANGALIRLSYSSYDTTGGIATLDTGSYNFTIDPTTHLASSYTLIWSKPNAGIASETHELFFDDQRRLIKDTLISGRTGQGDQTSVYFNYSGNGIVCNGYTMNAYDSANRTYGWGVSGIDSITLTNGNISSQYEYAQSGSSWGMSYFYVVKNYSSYSNPLFSMDRSSGLGALLRNYNSLDCVSKSLPADGMANWTTDEKGRIVTGIGTDGSLTTYAY
jgi:hypothetical protein